jgi:hypothetical protein
MKINPSVNQCLTNTDKPWWKCPSAIAIFLIFLVIFAYSIYISIECTYLIGQYGKYGEKFEDIYNKTLGQINTTSIMSNLMCLISALVLFGFILKTIPESKVGYAFSYSTGMMIALYLFIYSSIALSTFAGMNFDVANSIVGFSAFILVCSLVIVGLFSYQIHLKITN